MTGPGAPGPTPHGESGQIPEPERRGERLAGLLILGLAFLNYPLMSLFSGSSSVHGIPVLYLYLFAAWAFIIGGTAIVLRNRPSESGRSSDNQDSADR